MALTPFVFGLGYCVSGRTPRSFVYGDLKQPDSSEQFQDRRIEGRPDGYATITCSFWGDCAHHVPFDSHSEVIYAERAGLFGRPARCHILRYKVCGQFHRVDGPAYCGVRPDYEGRRAVIHFCKMNEMLCAMEGEEVHYRLRDNTPSSYRKEVYTSACTIGWSYSRVIGDRQYVCQMRRDGPSPINGM